ncbi:hypothetical protein Cob_v006955 [Colletotrichum orbiculare MAFF 240422]|uniref:Secreted protein n=1 Tax=Colletotrichum orbiculare (strain 104-T / ATCC 96160 / CBS 514.97 / LARS 414 / MAFF 240422) TaxID=1213857 RepID=N4VC65_COLOR|nr:hypothetical protein Cob_v006955 [Colletotrichum orbiculare MAFF 240422]
MLFNSLLLGIAGLSLTAAAAVVSPPISDGLENYQIVDMQWELQAFPSGPFVLLNGTIEEAHQQLLAINPNYDAQFPAVFSDHNATENLPVLDSRMASFSRHHCPPPGSYCSPMRIREGIEYLYRVSGRPRHMPGPATCSRVSCSWNSAIYWCNDNTHDIELSSFGEIADGAQYVADHCTFTVGKSYQCVSGQAFHHDNWNVLVRKDNC